ncbi:putative trafficking pga2 protein [Phaeoacremonium minimum UCRPA7]|uniref:Putative trafficking pga2 protein n=1 Tax=Phaeoacremonium minimum (strain UCR-PA7) TaxID=1286976 RepID=R8BQ39_PHAM7|nr:putative trafficking pga2 protein [Phaeoacremonium minimum UCRPA7]EOO01449.1 putative trafficking pga2 protein [Phaeoacremonium minimum UCRPA7]
MADLLKLASTAGERFTRNLGNSFAEMSLQKWIRVVIIVGAYLLLRPYLIKLGAKQQMKAHEKEEEESARETAAKISANELRGQKLAIPEDSESEGEAEATSADWGKKARRRQRDMIKKMIAVEEKRLQELQEDEEDKDIQEFLTE